MPQQHSISFWYDTLPSPIRTRPALQDSRQVDVAIIGAGYTGLWTAYYLKKLAPHLSVAVLESEIVGFGASGRNGGWLQGCVAGEDKYLQAMPAPTRAVGYRLLHETVNHVQDIVQKEAIECSFHQGGVLFTAARYPEQGSLLRREYEDLQQLGLSHYQWLSATELNQQLRVHRPYGAIFSPHCAVINPAQLVRGLAEAVERQGVTIYEKSAVQSVQDNTLTTAQGQVKADKIVVAIEGYASSLRAYRSFVLPVQSLIIATEPLSDSLWDEIGLANRQAFSDNSRLITYGQKSADGRLIFGARGAYQFGAKPRSRFSLQDPEFALRKHIMHALFPMLKNTSVTHGWGGTLGVARRFAPHALYDAQTGMALVGGYGGSGVAATNLFARTVVDLMLARDTELTQMPWAIQHRSPQQALRSWEPEPIPWLTYQTIQAIYRWEDALYSGSDTPSWRKTLAGKLSQVCANLLS